MKKNAKNSVSKAVVDSVRTKAKAHLLAMGWKFRYEWKCTRQELHYFTPEGKRFVSFYVACSAYDEWEKDYINRFLKDKKEDATRNNREKKSSQFSDGYDANPSDGAGSKEVPAKVMVHKVDLDVQAPAALKPSGIKIIPSRNSTEKDNVSAGGNEKNRKQNIEAYNIKSAPLSDDFKDNLNQFPSPVSNSKKRDKTKQKRYGKAVQVHTDASSSRPCLRSQLKPFRAEQNDRARGKVTFLQ